MPSWLNSWFGSQAAALPDLSDATLEITDGELTVDFTRDEAGWFLLGPAGWGMTSADLKGGGYYANSLMVDGQQLRHAAFDNVTESWRVGLRFYSADGMLNQIDALEELLKVRAPRYWADRRYHKPVYIKRHLPSETNTSYALVSVGRLTFPQDMWDVSCTMDNGLLEPVLLTYNRQPFWTGAVPGTAQETADISARQDWDYELTWAQETNLPAGLVYCFAETTDGLIYAGGANEILRWWNSSWNVVNAAPVALAGNIRSVALLQNGDLLFGDNGQIVKLSGGTWSVETSLPTGEVTAILEANDGQVYAGDDKAIWKRDTTGTWALQTNLPLGNVYSLLQTSTGYIFAGEAGRILRTADADEPTELHARVAALTDNAEQWGTTCSTNPVPGADLDLFSQNYVAVRFQLDVGPGDTINSAELEFTARWSNSGTAEEARIYCEDADNASAFSATTNNVSSRTLTTAYVSWQPTVKWKRGHTYASPDISAVIQEVVDRSGWVSGNYIVVIVKCNTLASYHRVMPSRRQCHCYDSSPDDAPRLNLTYTPVVTSGGWEINSLLPDGNVTSLLESSVSGLLLAGDDGQLLGSDDESSWGVISTAPSGEVRGLYEDSDGNVWVGDDGTIYKSVDGGRNIASHSALPTSYAVFIEETTTGDLRAGDSGQILILDETLRVTLGRTATNADEVYVANHHKTCNITDIKLSDGGVFQDLFPMSTFPTQLYPNVPAVDDALYFGIDTSLDDTGLFCSLIFDIGIPARWTTSGAISWEYYNGAWVTLTAQDNTDDFTEAGVNSVAWKQPSDWTEVAVDGVTGYWVRARVSSVVGTMVPPTQQNRDIYSAVWDFVELDDDQAAGNIDSLVRLKVHNRGDNGGPGGSEPLLYFNRLLVGAKEYENHEDFRAFLNFADEQNPTGVSVDVTVDTDSATSVVADPNLSGPIGRCVFFDAGIAEGGGGLNNLIDRVEIELDTTIAAKFYGTYLPFVRCYQSGGSAGEVTLRIKVVSGSGGISSLGDIQATQSTTDHEVVEFKSPITIPVSAQMTDSDIGDTTSIIVQIAASANDADLYLYDLFLLPVDGPWLDAKDTANTAESSAEKGRRLLVDAIGVPKAPTRAMVEKLETAAFVSGWRVDGNGQVRVIAGKKQRLWFLACRTTSAGTDVWISEPEVLCSIVLDKTDRWLLGRGAA